jgi:XcyI restriction endonuclease
VPRDAQRVLAGAGIRDEAIFPTPAVLEAVPRCARRWPSSCAAGAQGTIIQAADPDVRIEEGFEGEYRPKTAIEIKGGTDKSNATIRAGEAEESHQKAKGEGFRDYWTVIATKGLDMGVLESESPTTNSLRADPDAGGLAVAGGPPR